MKDTTTAALPSDEAIIDLYWNRDAGSDLDAMLTRMLCSGASITGLALSE